MILNIVLVILIKSDVKCARCGQCCFLVDPISKCQTKQECPYLVFLGDGTTSCKIYFRNRVGRKIGLGNKCNLRESVKFNFPGCPFNKDGQEFIQKEEY